jgi:lipoprotein signal peptidase
MFPLPRRALETRSLGGDERDPSPHPEFGHRAMVVLLTAGLVCIVDLGTKAVALIDLTPHQPTWLIGAVVGLDRVDHGGLHQGSAIAAGLLAAGLMLALVAVAARRLSRLSQVWLAAMCGVVWGGILANNVDGIVHGNVTDWLRLQLTATNNIVVNIADIAITVGGTVGLTIAVSGLVRRTLPG